MKLLSTTITPLGVFIAVYFYISVSFIYMITATATEAKATLDVKKKKDLIKYSEYRNWITMHWKFIDTWTSCCFALTAYVDVDENVTNLNFFFFL